MDISLATPKLSQPNENRITAKAFGKYLKNNHPALWLAINHHRTHKNKPMTLKGHQYLKGILMDKSPHLVVMKSTQCGVSEALIIFVVDETMRGRSVFYVLPTHLLMGRFVANRFEKSLVYTKFYRSLDKGSTGETGKRTDNKSLKDLGSGVVTFAGSNTPVPFTEFPADTLVIDEKDRCHQDNIKMGEERLGHADNPRILEVSNPTITEFAIDESFQESDKKRWSIRCSNCGAHIFPDFYDHVVRQESENIYTLRDTDYEPGQGKILRPICNECEKPFDRFVDGEWVPEVSSDISGYQISKLFSGTNPLEKLVRNFERGLVNDFEMQRFYNSDLGLPYVQEGARISKNILDACKRDYLMPGSSRMRCVMGVDVGKVLHVRINEVLPDDTRRAVFIGTVDELSDLFLLAKQYNVATAVIDALPETRLSKQFSMSFPGGFRCFFGGPRRDIVAPRDKIITVDRTQTLDVVKEDLLLERILLPKNADQIPDYYSQMQASTRIYDEEKEVYRWEEGSKDDHFFLAEGYCSLAFKLIKFVNKR